MLVERKEQRKKPNLKWDATIIDRIERVFVRFVHVHPVLFDVADIIIFFFFNDFSTKRIDSEMNQTRKNIYKTEDEIDKHERAKR